MVDFGIGRGGFGGVILGFADCRVEFRGMVSCVWALGLGLGVGRVVRDWVG